MDWQQTAAAECGKVVLHVGNSAIHWGPSDVAAAAAFAAEHRVDSLVVKVADGTNKWYGSAADITARRQAALDHGVGFLPFIYAYGPRFGEGQIRGECAILAELMGANGDHHSAVADMEAEWDGQAAAADLFRDLMLPVPGLLYLSTWANVGAHNFPVRRLAPCVNAWCPQEYDDYLITCEGQGVQMGESIIFPTVDLSQEFGRNSIAGNVRTIRGRGHPSLWVWSYELAAQNPGALDTAVAAFKD